MAAKIPERRAAMVARQLAAAIELLARHAAGDWGEVPPEDARENGLSVREGFRIISSYLVGSEAGDKVWIITEADRSSTCILLPEDY